MSHGHGPGSCLLLWPAALQLGQSASAAGAAVCLLAAGHGDTNLEMGEAKLID